MAGQEIPLHQKVASLFIGGHTTAAIIEKNPPAEILWKAVVEFFLPATTALLQIKKEPDNKVDAGAVFLALLADTVSDIVFFQSTGPAMIMLKIAFLNPLLRTAAVLYAGEGKADPNKNG